MPRFLLVHPDPTEGETARPPEWIEGPDGYTLMRDAVDGWIEYLPTDRVSYELVCNEEYALADTPTPNTFATILWAADPLGEACVEAHPLGGVCGPVVVCGRTLPDGNTPDLSPEMGDLIIKAFHRRRAFGVTNPNLPTIPTQEDPE